MAAPAISPAGIKRSYERNPQTQTHDAESNPESPSPRGLAHLLSQPWGEAGSKPAGRREENQGEGSGGGEPCVGSGTTEKKGGKEKGD